MSEYGPAVFISREDKKAIDEAEQKELQALVKKYCGELKIVDSMDDSPADPWLYDYDGYEQLAAGYVLWANYAFAGAPEPVQEDMNADAKSDGEKIAKKLEAECPGVYKLVCYIVEV